MLGLPPARPCPRHNITLLNASLLLSHIFTRQASGPSRWKQRQGSDIYARDAKVKGLKSRAAFKLLEIDSKYRLFRKNQTVVDLGYAPGSWSQVAVERTKPYGRVVGIDLIPAQPPKGVSTFQGDFLSPGVQKLVADFIVDSHRRQPPPAEASARDDGGDVGESAAEGEVVEDRPSYIDMERHAAQTPTEPTDGADNEAKPKTRNPKWLVDIVLSDMSAPWDQTTGFSVNSLSNPYRRLMNTSGMPFRDHAGSMDLCNAALSFAFETLKPGGHFVCKFYQGAEDKALEKKLGRLFDRVLREKPESSRSESKEAYFVGLRRKANAKL